MRIGLLMHKVGCSAIYDNNKQRIPVTVLALNDNNACITDIKTTEKHGYNAVQLAFVSSNRNKLHKPQYKYLTKHKISLKRYFKEFRVNNPHDFEINEQISVKHFVLNQYVDVSGHTIGKGFAGTIKRHHFKGLCASHGVSISHRSHGSTGQCQDPGRIFKGKKMAGHMGNRRVTIQNLKIVYIDTIKGILAVKGAIPGKKGSRIIIRDAIKKSSVFLTTTHKKEAV